jgi:hypothetical protein
MFLSVVNKFHCFAVFMQVSYDHMLPREADILYVLPMASSGGSTINF